MHNVRVVSSVIGGKMRTIAWETAPYIALRNCSKGARGWGGVVSIYVILVMAGACNQVHIFLQKVSASHEKQSSPRKTLVLHKEIQELGS